MPNEIPLRPEFFVANLAYDGFPICPISVFLQMYFKVALMRERHVAVIARKWLHLQVSSEVVNQIADLCEALFAIIYLTYSNFLVSVCFRVKFSENFIMVSFIEFRRTDFIFYVFVHFFQITLKVMVGFRVRGACLVH